MSRSYPSTIERYFQITYQLARTLIFHMPSIAEAINRELEMQGHVIDEDKSKWRYYKHLKGEYHWADTTMQVESHDTHELIDFTKDNLDIHRQTKRNYANMDRHFRRLANRFPDQELLIRGILRPEQNIERFFDTPEGTIIQYDPSLVEPQEIELIEYIEDWAIKFLDRYSNEGFHITDELFVPARFGVMLAHLPAQIAHIRHQFHGTAQAHSFYIRQQLASYGDIDHGIDYLDFEPIHFLYRNAKYILHHAGQKHTQHLLIDNLTDPHHIPLHAHSVFQNIDASELIETLSDSEEPEFERSFQTGQEIETSQIKPEIAIARDNLGRIEASAHKERVSLQMQRDLQRRITPYNERAWDEDEAEIRRQSRDHDRAKTPTKTIDSAPLDRTDAFVFRFEDVTLFSWFDLAYEGIYRRRIAMTDPLTREEVRMTMFDLMIIYLYAINRANGVELEQIPDIYVLGLPKDPLPSYDRLRSLTRRYHIDTDNELSRTVEAMREIMPPRPSQIISYEDFRNQANDLFWARNAQRWLALEAEDHRLTGELIAINEHHWEDRYLPLSEMGDFHTYFDQLGFRAYEVEGELSFEVLAREVLDLATGLGHDRSSAFERTQEVVLGILERMSSYSVHYIKDYHRYDSLIIDPRALRHSAPSQVKSGERHALSPRQILDARHRARVTYSASPQHLVSRRIQPEQSFYYWIDVGISEHVVSRAYTYLPAPRVGVGIEKVEKIEH